MFYLSSCFVLLVHVKTIDQICHKSTTGYQQRYRVLSDQLFCSGSNDCFFNWNSGTQPQVEAGTHDT